MWRNIWSIQAMPKMLNVVWRATSNRIPTKSRLKQMRIIDDGEYPVCGRHDETSLHIF